MKCTKPKPPARQGKARAAEYPREPLVEKVVGTDLRRHGEFRGLYLGLYVTSETKNRLQRWLILAGGRWQPPGV